MTFIQTYSKATTISGDGYAECTVGGVISTPNIALISIQVTGDDTSTWDVEGSMDNTNWSTKLVSEDGGNSWTVNDAPELFNVEKYAWVRIYVAGATGKSFSVHYKGLQ